MGALEQSARREDASRKRKKKAPTAAIIDSQSVKMAYQRGERGFDAGKKIGGRKRHILVDTMGMILGVVVHSANVQDRDGAKLLEPFFLLYGWLKVIFADGGYAGALVSWMEQLARHRNLRLEIIKRPIEAKGFHLLPKRWVVERTFSWLGNFRRLSKDYEVKTSHSEAFIYIASSHLIARRLAKTTLQ
jgi:putative transposase